MSDGTLGSCLGNVSRTRRRSSTNQMLELVPDLVPHQTTVVEDEAESLVLVWNKQKLKRCEELKVVGAEAELVEKLDSEEQTEKSSVSS
ncbi:uncharacterized protein V6R79_004029 [Siganus canaliculatus]